MYFIFHELTQELEPVPPGRTSSTREKERDRERERKKERGYS
jgi:hypothetical protein